MHKNLLLLIVLLKYSTRFVTLVTKGAFAPLCFVAPSRAILERWHTTTSSSTTCIVTTVHASVNNETFVMLSVLQ